MGLLTDPSAGQGKLAKALLKYYPKLCILLYIAGIISFCVLAVTSVNAGTYFSENALLPGLVKSEFREDSTARLYYEELKDEMLKYDDTIPYPWLLAKMRQIGLDTYTHNFTLNYPLGKPQKFAGKNVYGILRAPRASSTEALVLSVPYRPPTSVHATTAPSVALMLAFAKFANKEKYWAKDLIFLITEHEQLGIQAWLEAYHGVTCGSQETINYGDLKGRAGSIQAAINLELHSIATGRIDLKIEGLNGQLPNLDLFNLAAKMMVKEGIPHTFKTRSNRSFRDPIKDWYYSFQTLMAMVITQATGIPNGNHGLYHRFGIEALTLVGSAYKDTNGKGNFLQTGRIIEGIYRSLNNLLERFHQSYFFYLLPSSERFVSIGLYMPAICLIAGTLFVKACAIWCQLQEEKLGRKVQAENTACYIAILCAMLMAHVCGVLIMNSPHVLTSIGNYYNYPSEASLFYGFIALSVLLLCFPLFVPFKSCEKSMAVLHIMCLLELGTALICISMTNFSLALSLGVIYVPLALLMGVTKSPVRASLRKVLWVFAHPLVVLLGIVLAYTLAMFPGDDFQQNFYRALAAAKQAIVFSIVDSMIYGNWLFGVVTSIFLPSWLCFWILAFSKCGPIKAPKRKAE